MLHRFFCIGTYSHSAFHQETKNHNIYSIEYCTGASVYILAYHLPWGITSKHNLFVNIIGCRQKLRLKSVFDMDQQQDLCDSNPLLRAGHARGPCRDRFMAGQHVMTVTLARMAWCRGGSSSKKDGLQCENKTLMNP